MPFKKITLVALAAMSLGAATAQAAVLFENPFAGQNTGWYSSSNTGYRVYDSFTLSSNSVLTGFQFSTYSSSYLPTTFNVSIFSDSTFGTTLFSQSYNISAATTANDGVAKLISVSLPEFALDAGTYWISPYGTSGGSLALNVTSASLDGSLIQSGSAKNDDLAMIITGNAGGVVPEPETLALLGLGLVGLVASRRRKTA